MNKIIFHFLALFTSFVWGSTFAVSKILLNAGLSPAEIMILRFLIAYLVMLPFSHKYIISLSLKDELMFVLCGLTAGSLYFFAENTAVEISSTSSTIALLVCLTPFFTALANRLVRKDEKLSPLFLFGSFLALCGTALVVFNGVFVLDDNPIVIVLSIFASICWVIYSLIVRDLEGKYGSDVITRKIFFWGIITMSVYFFISPLTADFNVVTDPKNLFSLLFLALVASLGCYLVWNIVIKRIGIILASNYLYFNPIVALITAYFLLDEKVTVFAVLGCILTILGVYICNTKNKVEK